MRISDLSSYVCSSDRSAQTEDERFLCGFVALCESKSLFGRECQQPRDQPQENIGIDICFLIVPARGHHEPFAVALAMPQQAHRQDAIFGYPLIDEIGPIGPGEDRNSTRLNSSHD